MAKLCVFAIRDSKVTAFRNPLFAPTIPSAIRLFSDAVNTVNENNELNRHPEDFELFYLGDFDDEYAKFDLKESPVSVCLATSCLQARQ